MEQSIMKTTASILVAILAAAIVSACAQDEPVSGPKAELNITALDSRAGDISRSDSTAIPRDTTSVNGTDSSNSSNATTGVPAASPRMIAANQDRDATIYDSWMRDIGAEEGTSSETVSQTPDITSARQFDAKIIIPDTASAQVDATTSVPDTSASSDIKTQLDTTDTFTWSDITAFFDIFTQPKTDTGNSTLPADIFMQQEIKTQPDVATKLPDIVVAVPDIMPNIIPDTTPKFDTATIPDTSAQPDIKTKFDTAITQPDIASTIPDTAPAKPDSIITKPDTATADVPTADTSSQIAKFTKKNDGTTIYNNTKYGYTTKFPSWTSVAEKKDTNLTLGSKAQQSSANFTIDLEYIEKPGYVVSYGDWFKELYGKPDEEITYQGKTMKFHSSDHGGGFNRYTYAPVGTNGALRIETNFSMPPEAFAKNFEQDALGAMYMVAGNASQLNSKP